ncbi:MAG TPA: polysaccharide deacetylase family protein [Polyangiaceae bacterium]|nr:polysaccharide deacetylase family protein [Polyangiaceae bacterium]
MRFVKVIARGLLVALPVLAGACGTGAGTVGWNGNGSSGGGGGGTSSSGSGNASSSAGSSSGSGGGGGSSSSSGGASASGGPSGPTAPSTCLSVHTDNVPASINPPAGLMASQVPQFVMFGFDDNALADGFRWVVNSLFGGRKNSDGTPALVTFFLIGGAATAGTGGAFVPAGAQTPQDVIDAWKSAYAAGHVLGNHTWDHADGGNTRALADWQTEIGKANDFITGPAPMGLGIPKCQVAGYRFPFLNFDDTGFQALQPAGLRYDTSIEFGYDWWIPPGMTMGFGGGSPESGKHYWWPFTLDNGVDPSFACCSKGVQAHPGLWEFPVHTFNRPDPSNPGGVKTCTGLDYNLWVTKAAVDATLDFCGTLKYSFDQRYNNNRAPMNVGCHSGIYSQWSVSDDTAFMNTYDVRRAALQCFVDYVLTFPDARIVSFRSVVEWMRSPKPLR